MHPFAVFIVELEYEGPPCLGMGDEDVKDFLCWFGVSPSAWDN